MSRDAVIDRGFALLLAGSVIQQIVAALQHPPAPQPDAARRVSLALARFRGLRRDPHCVARALAAVHNAPAHVIDALMLHDTAAELRA
ncbi:hypothetical protein [Ensifer sp. Root31]|uniref:hypothetical protein n=1 Tax=Ensifer sp. Root31 TaxID=1736512 RepID=UPI0012E97DE8|nr:hypothetical protein [Ensifer sp. Root31]